MCYKILFENKLMSVMSEKLIPNLMKIAGKEQAHTCSTAVGLVFDTICS